MKKLLTLFALFVATVAAYGDTDVVSAGYQPAGTSFSYNATINWASQKLVASIDVSGCTGENENILSVGNAISAWDSDENNGEETENIHIYYTRNTNATGGSLQVNYLDQYDCIIRATLDVEGDNLLISVSKAEGITVNGVNFNYKNDNWNTGDLITENIASYYTKLWSLTTVQVGSQQGSSRSNATYEYVRVEDLSTTPVEPVDPSTPETTEGTVVGSDGYQPAGTSFSWDASIDWETQKLVASIDVTGCTGSYENILSVGKNISGWNGECFHLYYSRSSKTLQVNYCTSSGNPIRMEKTVDADVLNVEITKANGIYVNGENWNYANDDNYTGDLTDDMTIYSVLWGLSEIQVGSQEGDNRSNATYKYVRVQDVSSTQTYGEGTAYNGNWEVSDPIAQFSGTVDVIEQANGKYALRVHGFQLDGVEVPTFIVPDLTGTMTDGNLSISQMANVPVCYEEETTADKKVTYVEFITVTIENGELSINFSYVGYGDGMSDYITNAAFTYDPTSGINAVSAAAQNGKADIYTVSGAKVSTMQKGVNIIRMNGKTVKVIKK